MIKKFQSHFLIALTIMLLAPACSLREPVDEDPFSVQDFNNNLLIGYAYLGTYPTRYFPLNEITTDELGIPGEGNNQTTRDEIKSLLKHTWTVNNNDLNVVWSDCYNGISIINNTLISAEKILDEVGDDKIGQARILRAYYHYLLLDLFGNIQVITEDDLNSGATEIPQLTRKEVFEFVESEIKAAIPLLNPESEYGIINRKVAQALLAKLYLNAEVYTGLGRWAECIAACDEVINSGDYALTTEYLDNFTVENNVSGKDEIIMVTLNQNICTFPFYSIHPAQFTPSGPSTSDFRNWAATPELYQAFDHDVDTRERAFLIGNQLTTSGNPVLDASGRLLNYRVDYVDTLPYMSGARLIKYETDEANLFAGDNGIPILRYADVLLMKAEALNETNDVAGAIALINQVRARAYEPDQPLDAGNFNRELLREQILQERAQELFWEGHRRQDLIRFGKFCEAWTQKPVTVDCETRKLFPIPSNALVQNQGLVQNPGY